jgi:HAD superfamily hydrolase (TIGR01450 family)
LTDVVLDLDGVVYKDRHPIEGAADALRRLLASNVRVTIVTNNSTRSATDTAENVRRVVGVSVDPDSIVTSSQAAASLLGADDWPALLVGEAGIRAALTDSGIPVTTDPSAAGSVVVGMDRSIAYEIIADAAEAVRNGARFIATNADPTYPTADRLLPGAGSMVAAIAAAAGRDPEIAGKPHAPIRQLLRSRGIESPWVIGDRLDTDIALADAEPGWRSILVLSGVTTAEEGDGRADHVVDNLAAAVDLVLARA